MDSKNKAFLHIAVILTVLLMIDVAVMIPLINPRYEKDRKELLWKGQVFAANRTRALQKVRSPVFREYLENTHIETYGSWGRGVYKITFELEEAFRYPESYGINGSEWWYYIYTHSRGTYWEPNWWGATLCFNLALLLAIAVIYVKREDY